MKNHYLVGAYVNRQEAEKTAEQVKSLLDGVKIREPEFWIKANNLSGLYELWLVQKIA